MPIELGIWRIDEGLQPIVTSFLDAEKRLEEILQQDISIASPNWMVIGRQVLTAYGKFIDLLAIDRDGKLIVLELKKDRTPREVVAQLLDYGSWIKTLGDEDIASIFEAYQKKYLPDEQEKSLDEAFTNRFSTTSMPDELNDEHELVVVAGSLDDSTERIVTYLAEQYGVAMNAVFFRVFKDGDREYLTRVWFRDPTEAPAPNPDMQDKEPWNGEFYVSFGHGSRREWSDAVKYGFVSAGGGSWYSRTLEQLEPGRRLWANVPGQGYVGVGTVTGPMVKVDAFKVKREDGSESPITEMPIKASDMFMHQDDPEKAEYLVPVKWEKTVSLNEAIKETGFFGNQNTVCKPRTQKWQHTVERLKKRFGVE